jgi:Zn-dependent protease
VASMTWPAPVGGHPPPAPFTGSRRPSAVFLALVAAFIASCVWAATAPASDAMSSRLPVFAVVLSGWVVSLCLHEYAHALVAYHGGDRSVIERGYLTLDPRKYTSVGLSLLMPIVFILLGGIGLPGGAVWVRRGAIRTRQLRSAMSIAGPTANLICAVTAALVVRMLGDHAVLLRSGLSYLGLLQVTAVLLNVLPVPGLDGFGVIEPWLGRSVLEAVIPIGRFGLLGVFALFIYVPSFNRAFFNFADSAFALIGGNESLAALGDLLFRFWQ